MDTIEKAPDKALTLMLPDGLTYHFAKVPSRIVHEVKLLREKSPNLAAAPKAVQGKARTLAEQHGTVVKDEVYWRGQYIERLRSTRPIEELRAMSFDQLKALATA